MKLLTQTDIYKNIVVFILQGKVEENIFEILTLVQTKFCLSSYHNAKLMKLVGIYFNVFVWKLLSVIAGNIDKLGDNSALSPNVWCNRSYAFIKSMITKPTKCCHRALIKYTSRVVGILVSRVFDLDETAVWQTAIQPRTIQTRLQTSVINILLYCTMTCHETKGHYRNGCYKNSLRGFLMVTIFTVNNNNTNIILEYLIWA